MQQQPHTEKQPRSTHLLLAHPPIFLLVVAIRQFHIFVCSKVGPLGSTSVLDSDLPLQPVLKILLSLNLVISSLFPRLKIINCIHHSSGSSSSTCEAVAIFFSSFDIVDRGQRRCWWSERAGSRGSTILGSRSGHFGAETDLTSTLSRWQPRR
jgi:hypothetical protein